MKSTATTMILFCLAITINYVTGITRNQTFSEYGLIFRFNTLLLDYDLKTKTGTPLLQGEFYIQGTNDTKPYNETHIQRKMPRWTKDNTLRVCFQFYDSESGYESREMIRWVLSYEPPQDFALFTP
jgi:hypothetical protein